MMRGLVRRLLRRAGYDLVRYPPPDFSAEDLALIGEVRTLHAHPAGAAVRAHPGHRARRSSQAGGRRRRVRRVLIIDGYGHWLGARKAVDEYFAEHGVDIVLARVDYSARIGVKR